MAQSTSHPDCVHCRFLVHHKHGEYRCRQHNMILHSPVSIYCKMIASPDCDDPDYEQWFDETIDADTLDTNTLYTWVETPTHDRSGTYTVKVDTEAITSIRAYTTWSAGVFWQMIRNLRITKRNYYRQHGYDIDDGK